jgi:hypothetical protein
MCRSSLALTLAAAPALAQDGAFTRQMDATLAEARETALR